MPAFKTIVVATDFSEHAEAAIDRACELARLSGGTLHVLYVMSQIFHEPWAGFVAANALERKVARERRDAETLLSKLMARRGMQGRCTVATASGPEAADEIIAYATQHQADLIVCGTHGRQGLKRLLLGSVAERVVHEAPCAVLTVRLPGLPASRPNEVSAGAVVSDATSASSRDVVA